DTNVFVLLVRGPYLLNEIRYLPFPGLIAVEHFKLIHAVGTKVKYRLHGKYHPLFQEPANSSVRRKVSTQHLYRYSLASGIMDIKPQVVVDVINGIKLYLPDTFRISYKSKVAEPVHYNPCCP